MYEKNNTKKIVIAGLLLAIGIIIPSIFHLTGMPGKMFLPMHIPVLIGGFLLQPWMALALGILTPLLNSFITGMPVLFPSAIIMVFELGIYGFMASLAYRKMKLPAIVSLIISMIVGRLVAGLVVFILATFFSVDLSPMVFVIGTVTTGLPGIVIQIILIPTIIHSIIKYTTINLD